MGSIPFGGMPFVKLGKFEIYFERSEIQLVDIVSLYFCRSACTFSDDSVVHICEIHAKILSVYVIFQNSSLMHSCEEEHLAVYWKRFTKFPILRECMYF